MTQIIIQSGGPHLSLQDFGRLGHFASGISVGGAADPLALCEAAALLGGALGASLEMAGHGGRFRFDETCDVALTGAPMRASVEGKPLLWGAVHRIEKGAMLEIWATERGVYGYLTPRGGILSDEILGSRSVQSSAGIGSAISGGESFRIGGGTGALVKLRQQDRFSGGLIRFVKGSQSHLFDGATFARFEETGFKRDPRGNRQGVALAFDGIGFAAEGQLSRVSDFITVGDIQMTGDGRPYVLLADCQTIGGYPRIGTVIPADLPKIAQAGIGAPLRFAAISLDGADRLYVPHDKEIQAMKRNIEPLVRDPHEIADLLAYQLIDGMITGDEEWL